MHADVVIIRLVFAGILIASGYVLEPIKSDLAWISNAWISAAAGAIIARSLLLWRNGRLLLGPRHPAARRTVPYLG